MDNIIEVKNITFKYADGADTQEAALDDVSISVERGSFVTVIGHNGSGKSTLAKHLNGLFLPSDGIVIVDGMDTAVMDVEVVNLQHCSHPRQGRLR